VRKRQFLILNIEIHVTHELSSEHRNILTNNRCSKGTSKNIYIQF